MRNFRIGIKRSFLGLLLVPFVPACDAGREPMAFRTANCCARIHSKQPPESWCTDRWTCIRGFVILYVSIEGVLTSKFSRETKANHDQATQNCSILGLSSMMLRLGLCHKITAMVMSGTSSRPKNVTFGFNVHWV